MDNILIETTVKPSIIIDRTEQANNDEIVTAHRMVETYCNRQFVVLEITSRFTVNNASGHLPLSSDHLCNQVISVADDHGQEEEFTYNDVNVFPKTVWSSNPLVVRYTGGLPFQIYDAIIRQAQMLSTRDNLPAEQTTAELGSLKGTYATQYRTGLSPDVKQMIFPFKVIEF